MFKPVLKRAVKYAGFGLMAAVLMAYGGAAGGGAAASASAGGAAAVFAATPGKTEITVTGTGYVNIVPDVAYVTLGVNTQNTSPKVAQEQNNVAIANVIKTIVALGIEEKDIKTANFYMYPQYDYSSGKGYDTVIGYTVSNNVTVTVRDIDMVGDVLGAAADAGANISSGVQFGLLDSVDAYNKALKLAIANAGDKADVMAAALGKSGGVAVSVTESGGAYRSVYQEAGANLAAMDAAVSSVPVQSGELTVTANVQIVYEY